MAQITQLDDTILGLIPLQPKRPLVESLEWLTDITPSYNGGEEPNSMRTLARQAFRTEFTAQPDDSRDVFNTVYGGLVRQWAIPIWAQAQSVGSILAGTDVLALDTTFCDYRVDTPVFVTNGCGEWQYAYITAVNVDSIELDRDLDVMRAAFAMPVRVGRIISTPSKQTRGYDTRWVIEYEVDDNVDYEPDAPTQFYDDDIYFDYNLLTESGGPVTQQFVTQRETFDFKTGIVEEFTPWTNNRTTQPYRILKTTQAEAWELRQFLYRRRGKWRPFWLPTFEADLRVTSTGALTTTLLVQLDSYLPWAEVRSNIAVKKTDGTWLARRITDAIVSAPGIAQLTLDASLAINASAIEFVSWLGRKRLDADKIEMQYIGNNHCTTSFPLIEIAP